MIKNNIIQFIKFCIVGTLNTVVYLLIYYLFIFFNEKLYILGNIIGWSISVLNAWFFSHIYVFPKEKKSIFFEILKSYISYGASFFISIICIWIQVEFLQISTFLAPILTLFITVPMNFYVNKYWTFR